MIRAAALCLIATGPAWAGDFCMALGDLPQTRNLTLPMPDATSVTCSTGRAIGGVAFTHCGWPFPFRDATATQAFDALHEAILACANTHSQDFSDQLVNHPDSYDLRLYQFGQNELALSLKDKGALQKTYVFLRLNTR